MAMRNPARSSSSELAVPDNDVGGLDAGLKQALADSVDEFDVGGDAASAESIHFQTHGVAGTRDMAPCGGCIFGRCWGEMAAAEERHYGAVEECLDPVRIDRGACAAQIGIAGNHNTGIAGRFRGGRGRLCRSAQARGGAKGHGASEALREKVPPATAAKIRHKKAPARVNLARGTAGERSGLSGSEEAAQTTRVSPKADPR